jgi:uncharacterized membrane protein
VQLSAPKGTLPHRTVGWVWVALMFVVCVSSFFIHDIRMWGPWSPIHLLSIYVLIILPLAVLAARRHAVERHRRRMLGLFLGALVIAGAFTFWPGRIMHAVVLGVERVLVDAGGWGANERKRIAPSDRLSKLTSQPQARSAVMSNPAITGRLKLTFTATITAASVLILSGTSSRADRRHASIKRLRPTIGTNCFRHLLPEGGIPPRVGTRFL